MLCCNANIFDKIQSLFPDNKFYHLNFEFQKSKKELLSQLIRIALQNAENSLIVNLDMKFYGKLPTITKEADIGLFINNFNNNDPYCDKLIWVNNIEFIDWWVKMDLDLFALMSLPSNLKLVILDGTVLTENNWSSKLNQKDYITWDNKNLPWRCIKNNQCNKIR